MTEECSLKYSDVQSVERWLDEKSPQTAKVINHFTDEQLIEAKSLLDLIASNQASYQLASKYCAEIFESKGRSGDIHGTEISDELFQEIRFQAFLVMMDPVNDPADYHELHSAICMELLDGTGLASRSDSYFANYLTIFPLLAGLLLLVVDIT